MSTLAIIPARRGSKGLAGKNVHVLLGRPVVAYTIDFAKASIGIDDVVVSTDDPRAVATAREAGVRVVARPRNLAGDKVHIADVLRHAVRQVAPRKAHWPEAVVLLYANIPVRRPGVAEDALALLDETGADAVLTVAPVGKYHPGWMLRLGPDHKLDYYASTTTYRRQDLEPLYVHDGAMVVLRTSVLMSNPRRRTLYGRFGKDVRLLVEQPGEAVDVDHRLDLRVAEAMLRDRGAGGTEA